MDTVAIRDLLFEKQKAICFWCGETMHNDRANMNDDFATIEHVIPRSFGGKNCRANLALAHARCNHMRNAKVKLPLQWVQQVHAMLAEARGYLDGMDIADEMDRQLEALERFNKLAYETIREKRAPDEVELVRKPADD